MATPLTVHEIKDSLPDDVRTEIDKPDFLEPLKLFLEGLNNMADLKDSVKESMKEKIRQQAIHRVEVQKAIEENPDVLKTEINPVVIIGMARTGTSMLQRLLANAPDFVSPMPWEVMFPSPPGRPDNWKECARFKRAQEALEKMFPGGFDEIQHKHQIDLETPEECMYILNTYFLDIGLTQLPEFEKWKNFSFNPPRENLRSAYEYYKKALQCIFYKGLDDGKMPLLKAPIHTLYLDMYRKLFPNAKFIFPYRNAREMIGSGCSIFSGTSVMFGMDCRKEDIKKYTLEYYKLASSSVVRNLKEMPQESFICISYSELVKDPLATMRNIYSHFGWKYTPEAEECMQRHMQENRQHKHGKHKYSLEEYGVTEDEVRQTLPEFLDYFGKKEKLL